jgi:hypothetical protein
MRRISNAKVGKVAFFVAALSSALSGPVLAQIPPEAVDLDRTVAFSEVRPVTMFRAYGDTSLYYILRSGLKAVSEKGATDATLLYRTNPGDRSFLSLKLITSAEPKAIGEAIKEVKAKDPLAKFAYVEPTSFKYTVSAPASAGGTGHVEQTIVPGDRETELLVSVDPILRRVLLIPASYQFVSLSVVAATTISGVTRDENGVVKIGQREIDLSTVVSGSCALLPGQYINVDNGVIGCLHPPYSPDLIKALQQDLYRLKLIKFHPDGRFGTKTEAAIRTVQERLGLVVDGIPSQRLVDALKSIKA